MTTSISTFADQPPATIVDSGVKGPLKGLPFAPYAPAPVIAVHGVERRPRPEQVLLGTLSDFGFRVLKAIPARIEERSGPIIASWNEIEEFGTGTSTSSALSDLGHTIAELFRSLESDQGRLGPDLARVWSTLKEHIARR